LLHQRWIESFLNEKIDDNENREASIIQLEKTLHDGVVLAKLARRIQPGSISHIISGDAKFKFLRSNNINAFLSVLQQVGLPVIFWFEFVDLYDGKNMPKVIYCIHALSHLLHSNQTAPKIKNLHGEFNFSDEVLVATQRNLEKSGASMPNFNNLGSSLQKELYGGNKKKNQWSFIPIEEPLLLQDEVYTPKKKTTPELIVSDLYDDSDSESRTSVSDDPENIVPIMQRLQFLGKLCLFHRI
jgi:hypothetical protein